MIAVAAALLLLAGNHQSQSPGILGQGGSITLPPPIHEQVRPYRACLLERFERDPRIMTGGEVWPAVKSDAIAACAATRRTAAAAADGVLRSNRAYRNEAKRRSSIEKVLADLDSGLLLIYLSTVPAPVVKFELPAVPEVQVPSLAAPAAPRLTDEQAAIVYDQCLARSAARASRTDAADTAIFGIARAECAGTRWSLLSRGGPERGRIFDAIDADKQAGFPEATRKVRERRRAFEAQAGTAK